MYHNCAGVQLLNQYGPFTYIFRVNDDTVPKTEVPWYGGDALKDAVKDAICPLSTNTEDLVILDVN